MKLKKLSVMFIVLETAITGAFAKDNEKPSAEVQAQVTQAIKAKYPDAAIIKMGNENEDGLNFVGVQLTAGGTKMDVDVTADGTLVGSEEDANIQTFPDAAAKALQTATKGLTVKDTEIAKTYAKADPNDKTGTKVIVLAEPTIAYEMDVEKDGQKGEFSVDANGTFLETPKWTSKHEKSEGKEGKD